MKLSVITVVYNGASTIEQTIQSVIAQKNADIEYIIIDGGSSDGTNAIIEKYRDSIDYYISEPDEGIYDAMNKAIDVASGDIVSFINSDDWYEENVLKGVISEFERKNADILCGRARRIKDGEFVGYVCMFKAIDMDIIHYRNIFCHQGMFIRRRLFEEIGLFDTKYKILADYDWNIRAYDAGTKIELLDADVSNFRVGGVSTTSCFAKEYYEIAMKHIRGYEYLLSEIEKQYALYHNLDAYRKMVADNVKEFLHILPRDKKYCIWGIGDDGDECAKLLEKIGCEILFFIDNFAKKKTFHDKEIYTLAEVEDKMSAHWLEDVVLLVSSTNYEKEIVNQIENSDVRLVEYSTYREILEWAGERSKSQV